MKASILNIRLLSVYANAWQQIESLLRQNPSLSAPLLIRVPESYLLSEIKLMVVGQQTCGWSRRQLDGPEPYKALTAKYSRFAFGGSVRGSPFWQASHSLYEMLNPNGQENGFLWTNLVKVDEDKKRPSRETERDISRIELVSKEIAITEPDVVVFFTGPKYRRRLDCNFPGVEREHRSKLLTMLSHSLLPKKTFETYHPNYLRLSKNWAVISKIAASVRG